VKFWMSDGVFDRDQSRSVVAALASRNYVVFFSFSLVFYMVVLQNKQKLTEVGPAHQPFFNYRINLTKVILTRGKQNADQEDCKQRKNVATTSSTASNPSVRPCTTVQDPPGPLRDAKTPLTNIDDGKKIFHQNTITISLII
jgi:hypothetical protein